MDRRVGRLASHNYERGVGMPLRRLGKVTKDPLDTSKRNFKYLPWTEAGAAALATYRNEQPSAEELARAEAFKISPIEFLKNPHLRVRALESELAHFFRTWMTAIEQTLDAPTATKVAYAAGLAHGTRRLGTFLAALGLPGGTESMAMRQDTAHAGAGMRHTSALWARYDDELVEVVRTEDSFGAHTGKESEVQMAFFDGFIDGYQAADPSLTSVEELMRERPDGAVEFVHRFWYLPKNKQE
jgi:hypothetical protein